MLKFWKKQPPPHPSDSDLHARTCRGTANDVKKMKELLTKEPQLISTPHYSGDLPLTSAILNGHLRCAEYLIAQGANEIILKPPNGNPHIMEVKMKALSFIIMATEPQIFKLLNKIKINFELNEDHPKSLYLELVTSTNNRNQLELIKFLLNNGVCTEDWDYFRKNPSYESPLYYSFRKRDFAACVILIKHGAVAPGTAKYPMLHSQPIPHLIHSHTYKALPNYNYEANLQLMRLYKVIGGNFYNTFGRNNETILDMLNLTDAETFVMPPKTRSSDAETLFQIFNVLIVEPEPEPDEPEDEITIENKVKAWNKYKEAVIEIATTPRTLQSICRMIILENLAKSKTECIDELPVPDAIKNYLNFEEL